MTVSAAYFNPMSLEGRRYLITGAASGIGRAVATLLARLSARVVCVDIDQSGLAIVKESLQGAGHEARSYDLRDLDGMDVFLESIGASGPLHGFVHAAGISCIAPLRALTAEMWRASFTVNAEAALALTKAFQSRKVYVGENGSIVFISSVMALVGDKAATGYAMSKAALHGITHSLAIELAQKGIRVNCLAPGFVRTPMYEKTEKAWTAEQKAGVEALHPMGIGRPADVANAAAFLLADTGRWITGSVLVVDGGYTAR